MNYLFVYGTLMLKYPENKYAKIIQANCLEAKEAYTSGNLYLKGTYPALVEGNEKVFGEILLLDNIKALFPVLDEYEGYYENNITSSYYLRKQILCKDLNENEISCWAYIYNKPVNTLKRIESGRFY